MDVKNRLSESSKYLFTELLDRSRNVASAVNQASHDLEKVDRICGSKMDFFQKTHKELLKLEEQFDDFEQEIKCKEREQCKMIGTVMNPVVRAKCRMLNQLDDMHSTEIETVSLFENQLQERSESLLTMLKEYNHEKQHEAEQEKMDEVRQWQAKSDEMDAKIRQKQDVYGVMPKNPSVLEPYVMPGSALASTMTATKNLTSVIRSRNEMAAKINAALESDLEEQVSALEEQLMILKSGNPPQFNGQLADLM